MTIAEMNQARLQAASRQAAEQAGVDLGSRNAWTASQAKEYVTNFRQIILSHANDFTEDTVLIAQRINANSATWSNTGDDDDLLDPNAVTLWITDEISSAVEGVKDTVPGKGLGNAADVVNNTGNALVNAANSVINTVNVISSIAPVVIPAALLIFLWFASRNAGKDPAGQASKFLSGAATATKSIASVAKTALV